MTEAKTPNQCTGLEDVRLELDRLDAQLVALFARRHHYVQRVAALKNNENEAYDSNRIDDVIAKVRKRAIEHGGDADQAEMVWRSLIDWNINYEKGIIAARQVRD
ncbi:MAG: chorismate mutase [Alphaproteobacteria bacterium]|nr:chorismate mutase [Alphaproteobacteria bacterium]